ncbi:hypothetical protein [Kitasatospora sp. MBT63]|uniref:hypothetical protein n=1 Tax=Kitasatospora sp. MBT63 TaxID=1444768 RepID=UPI000AE4E39C|nr:hypothetical protein [Kitasatospora sp. MBT63]
MLGERPDAVQGTAGFEARWCACDLGEYRPCRGTYEYYPYESLPPLEPGLFTGDFDWLGGVGSPVPERVAELDAVAAELAAVGLELPADFRAFAAGEWSHRVLDEVSVTCCWSDLSKPLPSPVEPGAFLVRFLRDQQDCVIWYLYLRPSGETFVVHSPIDFQYAYEARESTEGPGRGLGDPAGLRAAISWCAPSFEQFAHRFWIENRLWHLLNLADGGAPARLAPEMRAYLRHYAPAGAVG